MVNNLLSRKWKGKHDVWDPLKMTVQKLTLKKIALIVADYHTAFPDLQLVGDDLLVRFAGPVAQVIWFDRLRTGAYRPTCRIHVLAAPSQEGGTAVLAQFVNIKVRETMPTSHEKSVANVVAALKTEILPSLSMSLDVNGIAELLQDRSHGRPASAYALACLFGALGRSKDAVRWAGEYRNAVAALGLPVQPIDAERGAFLSKISEWVKLPTCDALFAEVVAKQKALLLQC